MKRRSSTRRQPERPVFFVDADLCGKAFLQILRDAGIPVESHNDHFPPGTPDEEWLQAVGAQGWVALSRNKRIRNTSLQTAALMQSGLRAFMLIGDAPHREHAENFVRTLSRVLRFLEKHEGPFIAKISRPRPGDKDDTPGEVEMWLSYKAWQGWHERGLTDG